MRPLQDQCDPTPFEDVEKLFVSDMGKPMSELFDDFNPEPIGVASLAQVHVGRVKETGQEVATKVSIVQGDTRKNFKLNAVSRSSIPICLNFAILIWKQSKCP